MFSFFKMDDVRKTSFLPGFGKKPLWKIFNFFNVHELDIILTFW